MPGIVSAHPLLSESHDRTIRLFIQPDRIVVHYLLEVDELRAARDLIGLTEEERSKIRSREQMHQAYLDYMSKTLANNLQLRWQGKLLTLFTTQKTVTVKDHLLCRFVFESPFSRDSTSPYELHLREGNFEEDDFSKLDLGIDEGMENLCRLLQFPQKELRQKPAIDRVPGDMEKLRTLHLSLHPGQPQPTTTSPRETEQESPKAEPGQTLFHLLLDDKGNRWILFLMAMVFGAAHALTPGHGKTLAAAYLVAERGTMGHALLLGASTTISHTAAVFLLAILLPWFFPNAGAREVEGLLGFIGGLIIAGLGLWLFLKRILNQADHHHGPMSGHSHLPDGTVQIREPAAGIKGVLLLGLAGGMIPCWDAVAMLLFAISSGMMAWAVPLLIAFSAGLALVLVAVGMMVVKTRDAIGRAGLKSDWLERISKILPLGSAVIVTLIGFWLCAESLK